MKKRRLKCFCDSESFHITKPGKQFIIICENCECKRIIQTPGVAAIEYTVSVPLIADDEGEGPKMPPNS